ncbi:sulfatase-like hydrolase/transferase [Paenibacillus chondroitinus]|uniref:Sulfatase-like hydrolase/transferase n=1 Tax=Paenibacillus chondroitinus TaxID=59842 RepID=A0ABU6D7T2_9BACL|nr:MULTISPECIES: sulfatase-like hydrolase/transferase [Paenibacillus]MCY9660145.1 sulfatase-like hydrolase/transferase [Paenibacillus anseongense]MEB4792996.1 sulfatase-like hydrolase/transferase [Paenibacillus chondroitinus]
MRNEKPNVILIMADQLRLDAIGAHTPNINRLKEEGIVFERAYCASPICVPARGAFFTGMYPNENGCLINRGEDMHALVRPDIEHLYKLMEHTWDSWHTGKQHLRMKPAVDESPGSQTNWRKLEGRYEAFLKENHKRVPGGSDYRGIVPEMVYGKVTRPKSYSIPAVGLYEEGQEFFIDEFIARDSVEAIRNRNRSKPFLLNAMFHAPHPPLEIPAPWFDLIKSVDLPENVGEWCRTQSPLQLYNLTGAIGTRYTRDDWKQIWKVYLGLVSLLDQCVGQIIEELKREDLYDQSLIIFTSDHGEMLGSHGLWQKMCMYEESVRTPLFMKFPADFKPAITSCRSLVSSIDVLPTLCDYAQIQLSSPMSGQSLMPLIAGNTTGRERIFIQYDGNGGRGNFGRCIVEGDYKLIVDMFKNETYLELYNVIKDPQERENLAFQEQSYRERIEQMLQHLREHMQATNDLLELPNQIYDQFLQDYTEVMS